MKSRIRQELGPATRDGAIIALTALIVGLAIGPGAFLAAVAVGVIISGLLAGQRLTARGPDERPTRTPRASQPH